MASTNKDAASTSFKPSACSGRFFDVEDGRSRHICEIATLAEKATSSPAELENLVVEFLDTLCAWLYAYHPTIEPLDCWFVKSELKFLRHRDASEIACLRLNLIGLALETAIATYPGMNNTDTRSLTEIVNLQAEIQIDKAIGDPQDLTMPNRLLSTHIEATRLLEKFQRLHALSARSAGSTRIDRVETVSSQDRSQPSIRKPSVNTRMLELLSKSNPNHLKWTAEQWASHFNCSPSTVKGTPAWKGLMKLRAVERDERASRGIP